MIKSFDKSHCVNGTGTFQIKDAMPRRSSGRCRPNQTAIQQLHHLESKFVGLPVCSVNVGSLRERLGERLEMLEGR